MLRLIGIGIERRDEFGSYLFEKLEYEIGSGIDVWW